MRCLIILLNLVLCFSLLIGSAFAYDPADYEYLEMSPYTGNPDATWKESVLESNGNVLWLRLDTTNNPLTGTLNLGGNSIINIQDIGQSLNFVSNGYITKIWLDPDSFFEIDSTSVQLTVHGSLRQTWTTVVAVENIVFAGENVIFAGEQVVF